MEVLKCPFQLTGGPRSRDKIAYFRHPLVPATTDDADDYESQLAWVRDRGYPEDGTHEAKLEWVKANGQLPPYPRQGTPLEKTAWARLSTAYRTDTSDTKWHGEDLSEPLLEYTVNRRSGEVVSLRVVRDSSLALSVHDSRHTLSSGATPAAHPAPAAILP